MCFTCCAHKLPTSIDHSRTRLILTKFISDISCRCKNTLFWLILIFILDQISVWRQSKNLPALIPTKSHYVEMTRVLIYLFKSTSFILGDLWLLIMYLKNKMSFMETADDFFSGQLCIFLPYNFPTGRNDYTFPSMPSSSFKPNRTMVHLRIKCSLTSKQLTLLKLYYIVLQLPSISLLAINCNRPEIKGLQMASKHCCRGDC